MDESGELQQGDQSTDQLILENGGNNQTLKMEWVCFLVDFVSKADWDIHVQCGAIQRSIK